MMSSLQRGFPSHSFLAFSPSLPCSVAFSPSLDCKHTEDRGLGCLRHSSTPERGTQYALYKYVWSERMSALWLLVSH